MPPARELPPHSFHARPVDVLESELARIWIVSDPDNERYVVGLFNWNGNAAERISYDLERLGLPAGKTWIGHEYWTGRLTAPFRKALVADVPPGACQVLALRPLTGHPVLLSSSRHVTQGLTDITGETWDGKGALSATTRVVAGETTRLTMVTGDLGGHWAPNDLHISKADKAAGVTVKGPAVVVRMPRFVDTAVVPGKDHTYHVAPLSLATAGETPGMATITVTAPDIPKPGPVPPKPDVHLADLKPLQLTSGWGTPRKDRSVGNRQLTIAGKTYKRGLGVHAASTARFPLKPEYARFVAVAGLDDEEKHQEDGTVIFVVRIRKEDRSLEEFARSPVIDWKKLTHWHFDIAIPPAAREIHLTVEDGGDGIRCDHADWVDAGFIVTKQ